MLEMKELRFEIFKIEDKMLLPRTLTKGFGVGVYHKDENFPYCPITGNTTFESKKEAVAWIKGFKEGFDTFKNFLVEE